MNSRIELENVVRDALSQHLKKPFVIAANWKMNMTILQGKQFLQEMDGMTTRHKLLIFPPCTALGALASDFIRNGIGYGPQNFSDRQNGAYTGEISLDMISEIGCRYALAGHSERRTYYHESDEEINRKVLRAVGEGMELILCIGETLLQRENGNWKEVLFEQLKEDLKDVKTKELAQIYIAYEPVWAIGTGKSASLAQIEETHKFLKQSLVKLCGSTLPILYGGSVNETNAAEIGKLSSVDGFLIGSAGLDAGKFREIIRQADNSWDGGNGLSVLEALAGTQQEKTEPEPVYETALLTEDGIKAIVEKGKTNIVIGSKCLITPLAMDCIRENQIQIRRAGDADGYR